MKLHHKKEHNDNHDYTIFYYCNGQLESEGNWKNGKKDGLWKYYNKKGILKLESNWKNGKKDGLWKNYNKKGVLKSERNYKDGKRVTIK